MGNDNEDEETVELCEGGSTKALTRHSTEEYIDLYLKKYTEQDAIVFERLWIAIQDCVGETLLSHLTAPIAANRTSAKPFITAAAFKAAVHISCGSDERGKNNLRWFWEIFEEMSKQDRTLVLKFMSGDSRIKPGHRYRMSFGGGRGGLPSAGTCGSSMSIPYYSSKEEMQRLMLAAFRLCGEIDLDGGGHYGDE